MPTRQERIELTVSELEDKGFSATDTTNGIYVYLENRKVSEIEVRDALGELADAVNVYSLRNGVVVRV